MVQSGGTMSGALLRDPRLREYEEETAINGDGGPLAKRARWGGVDADTGQAMGITPASSSGFGQWQPNQVKQELWQGVKQELPNDMWRQQGQGVKQEFGDHMMWQPQMGVKSEEADIAGRLADSLKDLLPQGQFQAPVGPAAGDNGCIDLTDDGPPPPPAPSMADMLANSLKGLMPGHMGSSLGVACTPFGVPQFQPDLSSQLLESLNGLVPDTGASSSSAYSAGQTGATSQEGQALYNLLQQHKAASEGAAAAPIPDLAKVPQQVDESLRSGDGTVHRLPPGFGAIPQDIIDNRLREREEERIRQRMAGQPCRYGRMCKRRDCPQAHPEGREIDSALNLCTFGRRCKRRNCFYDHPEGREIDFDPTKGYCKFGAKCTRADCLYDHPAGREVPGGDDARVCYFCRGSGHISKDCPDNPDSWAFGRPSTLAVTGAVPADGSAAGAAATGGAALSGPAAASTAAAAAPASAPAAAPAPAPAP